MKRFLLITFMLLAMMPSFAQNGKGQRVESLKIAYISGELNLDPATAEKFWPIYHQYEDELQAIIRERKRNNQDGRSVEEQLDQEQKVLDLKRKYSALFSKVLSPDQLTRLYKAEKEFRQMLLRRSQRNEARMDRMNERPAREERVANPRGGMPRDMAAPQDQQQQRRSLR
ncbi:MAG: hypothetical protein JNM44_10775 [Chitinophagaceae bacterium]|nr:hypothetical protein [Chitinophagaceae bacterium]